jgi:phospholipase C
MQSHDRRKFLRSATLSVGAAAALTAFPPSIRRALAVPAAVRSGTIKDVKHVVILTLENRSFDHYFGTMRGVRGFGDRHPVPLESGLPIWYQVDYWTGKANDKNAKKYIGQDLTGTSVTKKIVGPYHLDKETMNALKVPSTPHSFRDGQGAWNQGKYGFWPTWKYVYSMGYFKREEIPFQFQLAEAFTLCDAYHCSVTGGSDPNRTVIFAGTNVNPEKVRAGLRTGDQDAEPDNGRCAVDNADPNVPDPTLPPPGYRFNGAQFPFPPFKFPTIPEVLEKAGISWRIYQDPWDNMGGLGNGCLGFQSFRDAPNNPESSVFRNGMTKWTIDDLKAQVINGTLPQVSWIVPGGALSEHPSGSSPMAGAHLTKQVLDALTSNPEVWSKTVLFINFDENDGLFDHVPAPAVPSYNVDGTVAGKATLPIEGEYYDENLSYPISGRDHIDFASYDSATKTFQWPSYSNTSGAVRPYGLGPRVPMYVISPWSKGGWVNSQLFDHSSTALFLEKCFDISIEAVTPWHRAVCGDLTSAFNFASPNDPAVPALRDNSDYAAVEAQQQAKPAALPPSALQPLFQEPGTRPSRALPYELHTSARVLPGGVTTTLLFSNTGKQGAVFHVYDKLHLDRIPRRYTVEAGKSLSDDWDLISDKGRYDLWVLGPNGYLRHFVGTAGADVITLPECQVCYDVANGEIYLHLHNQGTAACSVEVRANAYRNDGPWVLTVPGGGMVEQRWSLDDSGRWYDFSVTRSEDASYLRRFAGRVENGQDGVSDPAFGTPS